MLKNSKKDINVQYTVLTVRDGILKISLNANQATNKVKTYSGSKNKKGVTAFSAGRVVVQGEFIEIFSNDSLNKSADKYLAKVLSIKEDVIEAVLLADDRPVKERFLAKLTGTTGRVRVGFDLLGRTVDALGQLLDTVLDLNSQKKVFLKDKLRNFYSINTLFVEARKKKKK
jgi:F0F1-type ATP synthase alpha subunit